VDSTKKLKYQKLLMSLVPESGDNMGNVTLQKHLREKIEDQGD
jgi:hypothetical protein